MTIVVDEAIAFPRVRGTTHLGAEYSPNGVWYTIMSRSRTRILEQAGALPSLTWRPIGTGKRSHVCWTPAHEAFLGLAPDARLADLWNVPESSVFMRRRRLAIPPCGTSSGVISWTAEMLRDLERMTNHQLAKKHGISAITAALKRRERNLAPATRWNTIPWTAAMRRALGTQTDKELARRFGLQPATVAQKRASLGIPKVVVTKVDWQAPAVQSLLGSSPDNVIAERLGVNPETVRLKRSALGIPRFLHDPWTPAVIARMGREPDRTIAESIGVTTSAVAWQRKQRSIPTWDTRAKGTPRRSTRPF